MPKFQQLSMPVVEVFLNIEEQILVDMAKRLRKHPRELKDNIHSWQMAHLQELGSLRQENIRMIAKRSHMSINEVTKMLKKAGYQTVEKHEGSLQKAVAAGMLVQPVSGVEESAALIGILQTFQGQAKHMFNLTNTTLIDQAQQAYMDILNSTVGKVLAGVQTPQQALRDGVQALAENGLPALIDKGGREWSTEAYVSMITRTMANNVANEMQFRRMSEYGADLIEVSSHMGARPKCFPYQGRIYSISGGHSKYPPLSSTSYQKDPAGLFMVNCRHVAYPFIPGVSKQRFEVYSKSDNTKVYEESQKQRYLERRIRHAKRELKMMQAMKDDIGIQKAKQRVRDRQAAIRQFIDATDRRRRYNREAIYS